MADSTLPSYTNAFLDFGGTLFSYSSMRGANFDLVKRAAKRLGASHVDPARVGLAFHEASRVTHTEFLSRPYYRHRELFQTAFLRWAEALGRPASPDFLDWLYEEQLRQVLDNFSLREDCLETLAALRELGLQLSIVSNIDDDYMYPMVEHTGLGELIHNLVSSEAARSCKPDLGIFRYACDKAGCTPQEVVFVGDSLIHDVAGAHQLGMTTVLIPDSGPGVGPEGETSIEPHHTIEKLGELLDIVVQ
jgi:putative hydrolase of the HAD superfamily